MTMPYYKKILLNGSERVKIFCLLHAKGSLIKVKTDNMQNPSKTDYVLKISVENHARSCYHGYPTGIDRYVFGLLVIGMLQCQHCHAIFYLFHPVVR